MKYEHGATLLTGYLELHGRTKGWLADECGVTRSTVHYWCTGQNRPFDDKLRALVAALTGVPPEAWYTEEESHRRAAWAKKTAEAEAENEPVA